jgi:hypothetical protein
MEIIGTRPENGKHLQEHARPGSSFGPGSHRPSHPATLTHEQVIHGFPYSPESLTRPVEGYYQVYLQRLADRDGLNGWLAKLRKGLPFATIGQGFLASDEFYNRAAGHG